VEAIIQSLTVRPESGFACYAVRRGQSPKNRIELFAKNVGRIFRTMARAGIARTSLTVMNQYEMLYL